MLKSIWEVCKRLLKRPSANRAWGEHKMGWTLQLLVWKRHCSLSQSCPISSSLFLYCCSISIGIHPLSRAWCFPCSLLNTQNMPASQSDHTTGSNQDEMPQWLSSNFSSLKSLYSHQRWHCVSVTTEEASWNGECRGWNPPDQMWSCAWKSTDWTRQCFVRPADGRWGWTPRHVSEVWSALSVQIILVRNRLSDLSSSVSNFDLIIR